MNASSIQRSLNFVRIGVLVAALLPWLAYHGSIPPARAFPVVLPEIYEFQSLRAQKSFTERIRFAFTTPPPSWSHRNPEEQSNRLRWIQNGCGSSEAELLRFYGSQRAKFKKDELERLLQVLNQERLH